MYTEIHAYVERYTHTQMFRSRCTFKKFKYETEHFGVDIMGVCDQ